MRACRAIGARYHVVLLAMALIGLTGGTPSEATDTGEPEAPWSAPLRAVDAALARRDIRAAVQAQYRAYAAALASRRWDGMLAVGEAYRRLGVATASRRSYDALARSAYLSALFRARHAGSVDGVLRAAEAFGALGDEEIVRACLRVAGTLADATRDGQVRTRVQALRERWLAHHLEAEIRVPEP
jgi:hypothetical protein